MRIRKVKILVMNAPAGKAGIRRYVLHPGQCSLCGSDSGLPRQVSRPILLQHTSQNAYLFSSSLESGIKVTQSVHEI